MCLTPILRPNTSYGVAGHSLSLRIQAVGRAFGKDVDHRYNYVPCGHCPDCVRARQNSLIQRADVESRFNHIFFATLTYNNAHLPKLTVQVPTGISSDGSPTLFDAVPQDNFTPDDAENALASETFDFGAMSEPISSCKVVRKIRNKEVEVSYSGLPSGVCDFDDIDFPDYKDVDFPYADIHHVQLLLKCLRNNLSRYDVFKGRSLKYIAVTELGKTFGRPHVHILFFVKKLPGDYLVTSLSGLKYVGSSFLKTGVIRELERVLWDNVFKFWSLNVGTRKFPKYEQLFTYRKRICGNDIKTTFDLHYVDPALSTEGTQNVSYYVTKYVLKASEFEQRRQRFLRLNLSESYYKFVWNVIKCRMTISKGFGVNGKCVSVDADDLPDESYVIAPARFSCLRYAEIMSSDDLPDEDASFFDPPVYRSVKCKFHRSRRRVMVPDPDVLDSLHQDVCVDAGRSPFPIFIDSQGVHRALGRYFYRFDKILSVQDFLSIYLDYDDSLDKPRWELSKREKDDISAKFEKTLAVIEANSTFDTSPALLYPGDEVDSNIFLNPLNHV